MEKSFIIMNILHYSTLLIVLFVGSITFRRLSTGQKIILVGKCFDLGLAVYGSIRIYNGLYSVPIVSVAEFIWLGIQLVYVDHELRIMRNKKLFRILGVLFLSIIPLHWIFFGGLNYRGVSQTLISLYLIIAYFYCITYRPVNTSGQLLRWGLLLSITCNFLFAVFVDYITWKMQIDFGDTLIMLYYRVVDVEQLLITISFLMAYFQKKKTHQLQE